MYTGADVIPWVIDICDSLLQILPKLLSDTRDLQLRTIILNTQDVPISRQCVLYIVQLLRKAVVVFTLYFDDYYGFKYMVFYNRFNQLMATSLPKALNIRYEEALISGAIDCDAAVVLVEAMSAKSFPVKKLVLYLDESCRREMADIKYSRDRVQLIFV